MFDPISQQSFAERERDILAFWKKKNIFKQSLEQREGAAPFTIYDGPPFATGLPHYGHLLAGTIKDVVPRYKTMKGFHVPRRFGWDCHGLPVENEIEKAQGLSGAHSIEAFGIAEFNEECRSIVTRYTKEWETTVERMGRWVDFSQTWHTMDPTFMESVWWVFKQLWDQGLVYKGYKVMPYSAKLGTPLSNFEAGDNYKEVDDPSITVQFPLVDEPETSLLAWTTTPWTLISNLAITVGPEMTYVKVRTADGAQVIVSEERLNDYVDGENAEILQRYSGKELEGMRYQPLFPYFAERAQEGAFRVIVDAFVTAEEGTGLVQTAPAFGETDFFACKEAGIDLVCPIDNNGCFTEEIPEYTGQFVKDTDKAVIRRIKESGRLFKQATIRHRYPFCWRSDTPLIYCAVHTWFVAVEKIKERLVEVNKEIHWVPNHLKEGRFGQWLEGARDWAISRNRYWGTPIPLWQSEEGDIQVIGSVEELQELTGVAIEDLHRHHIDQLTFTKEGKTYRRIPEVFDCWFESGSMPYGQRHYPFENQERFEQTFPADFIAEGLDQTRGWFYTLTVLSTALFNKPAFKNVIVNGIILAEDGAKMSKRLRNYPDPAEVMDRYGADAMRLYLLHSPVVKADDLCFSEHGVEVILRQILIPLWNSYSFFVTYATINDWKPSREPLQPRGELNRWILSRLHHLIGDVEKGMDQYDLSQAVEPFVGFVEELTNWYIRRSRRRFWEADEPAETAEAHAVLYEVLVTLCKIAAPFIPLMTESIYQNLRREEDPTSVHLCNFPEMQLSLRDASLEKGMAAVRQAVSLGHALRKEQKQKVRQPLPKVVIASNDPDELSFLTTQHPLIKEELNIKEVECVIDDGSLVEWKIRPNFRVLGKKVGKMMPLVKKALEQLTPEQVMQLVEHKALTLEIQGEAINITEEDVELMREVKEGLVAANSGGLTLLLDTTLNDSLIREGIAREVVNKINTMRREAGYEVTDRIKVQLDTTEVVEGVFTDWQEYICQEILAVDVAFTKCQGTEWDLNGNATVIAVEKVMMN